MLKRYILTLFVFILSLPIYSQSDTLFTKTFFPNQQKKLHKAVQAIKIGDNWKDNYSNYDSALFYYAKAYKFNSNNHELNFKIASVYFIEKKLILADSFATKSYQLKPTLNILFLNGRINHLLYQQEKAIDFYTQYISNYDNTVLPTISVVKKYISQVKRFTQLEKKEYKVFGLDSINTIEDDYSPLLLPHSNQLFYTSSALSSNNLSTPSANIYYCFANGKIFSKGKIVNNNSINIKGNSALSSISKSGKTMVIYHGFETGRLFYSKIDLEKEIKLPTDKNKLPSPINNISKNVIGGTFTPNGKAFYFSSKRKVGIGGYDLYYTKRDGKKWIEAVLVKNINTPYNEIDPYFSHNGDTLFFASDNENSIGGFDIFQSIKESENKWGKPTQLPHPINTTFDDRTPSTNETGTEFLISSNRTSSKGGLDIFLIDRSTPIEEVIEEELYFVVEKDTSHLELERIFEEHLIPTRFHIFNSVDSTLLSNAQINIYSIPDNILISQINTDTTGMALIKDLPKNQIVGINILKKGYELYSLNTKLHESDSLYKVGLKEIKINDSITLYNIFFDFNSSKIQASSFTELKSLLSFLNLNPNVSIQIEGHTDDVGDEDVNLYISQKRADAIVTYLIENGINKKRISSIGYGEKKPISDNSTKEGKAFNRRTEFKIIKN